MTERQAPGHRPGLEDHPDFNQVNDEHNIKALEEATEELERDWARQAGRAKEGRVER